MHCIMTFLGRSWRHLMAILCVFNLLPLLLWSQTTYYVDPAGNDAKSGRTTDSAWQTLAKVSGTVFVPGDQILFKRGGVWHEQLNVISSGSTSKPIVFGAYGSGARPIISAGDTLPNWRSSGIWTDLGGSVWSCSYPRYPAAVWLNGVFYGTCGNNAGGGVTTPTSRYRWWHDGTNTFKLYSVGRPDTAYQQIEIANMGRNTMVISGQKCLTFRSLKFLRGQQGVDLSNCDSLVFDSCAFLGTPKYSLWIKDGSDDGEVKNCYFDTGDTASHTFQFGGDAGTGNGGDIIAIQSGSRWKIHNDTVGNPGHDAISITGGSPSGAISQNNLLYSNEVFMNGGDYGRAFETQGVGTPSTCSGNRIYWNYVHGFPIKTQILGQGNEVSYNLFANGQLCPWSPYSDDNNWYNSVAISLDDFTNNSPNQNKVWNNTIVNYQSAGIVVRGGQSQASLKNNIINNTGLAVGRFTHNVGICLWNGTSQDTVQNNAIYNNGSFPIVYEETIWSTNTPISVDSLNTRSGGTSGHVISANIGVDPLLTSDYHLGISSPAINAGTGVGLSSDKSGLPVPFGPQLDMGAYESLNFRADVAANRQDVALAWDKAPQNGNGLANYMFSGPQSFSQTPGPAESTATHTGVFRSSMIPARMSCRP